jgi:hypothetical protein
MTTRSAVIGRCLIHVHFQLRCRARSWLTPFKRRPSCRKLS